MMLLPEIRFIQRGWHNCNSILIVGDGAPALVDTGHVDDATQLLALISAEQVDPATIGLIANTHCHWDHHGGNRALQAVCRAPIAMGSRTAALFQTNDRRAMWLSYFGVELELSQPDVMWQDGDVVVLSGIEFRVLHTPGHAPDAIALYQPEMRLLISSDVVFAGGDCGILNTVVHGPRVLDWHIETVETLRNLLVDVVLPGHGPLITEPAREFGRLHRRLLSFRADPVKMARHCVRRTVMASLMNAQPVAEAQFIELAAARQWATDYQALGAYATPQNLVTETLHDFVRAGLVRERNGVLTSVVPR